MKNKIHYREIKLEKLGLPKDYIDVYMYIITGDNSYLSSDYFIQYPTRRVIHQSKIRKVKDELLLLFGRLLIFGDLE